MEMVNATTYVHPVPTEKRLGGPHNRSEPSGAEKELFFLLELEPRTVQLVARSLYQLSYPAPQISCTLVINIKYNSNDKF
jgi:hypothetical protein